MRNLGTLLAVAGIFMLVAALANLGRAPNATAAVAYCVLPIALIGIGAWLRLRKAS